jgi:hypothetical protein
METIRPVFKKLLLAALILYAFGSAFILSNLTHRVGQLEHSVDHITGKCAEKH